MHKRAKSKSLRCVADAYMLCPLPRIIFWVLASPKRWFVGIMDEDNKLWMAKQTVPRRYHTVERRSRRVINLQEPSYSAPDISSGDGLPNRISDNDKQKIVYTAHYFRTSNAPSAGFAVAKKNVFRWCFGHSEYLCRQLGHRVIWQDLRLYNMYWAPCFWWLQW